MKNKHTPGNWKVEFCLDQSIFINAGEIPVAMIQSEDDNGITPEMEANAKLIAAAPELLEMVYNLKQCIKRLTADNLSQYDRDTEAQWEGEAHELLTRINPDYYNNANA